MTPPPDTVAVFADLHLLPEPLPIGSLRRHAGRGAEVFSFEYHPAWLNSSHAFSFDPDLAHLPGPQYPAPHRPNFGIFLDSAPDRWGRLLMQRRENLRAKRERRPPRSLSDWDFLLGVHDETRLGALRFQNATTGRWLDTENALPAPPIASLPELQAASLRFESSDATGSHRDADQWLAQLFAPGSSLGGARPKASVRDEQGELCIAKFPGKQDRHDIGAWELVAHRLARKAGIRLPPARAVRVPGSTYTTFVAKRFDRTPEGRRLPFVSAMTLTQRTDGEPGASYLELVDLLQSQGAHAHADCRELFRRVVFSILIHNTDDHLRNHGFLLSPQGITLSPAFDINPATDRNELALAINEVDSTCDVSIALDSHRSYGLTAAEAKSIVAKTSQAVRTWPAEATRCRIPRSEQQFMATAFPPA